MTVTLLTIAGSVLVAVVAASASVWAARSARRASPYDALAERVVHLESQVGELERRLEAQEKAAREQAERFRARIHVLLRHIAALTTYAEMLIDLLRQNRIPMVNLPEFPSLPEGMDEDI